VDAEPAVVVHANDRFRLLDLQAGSAALAAPYGLTAWDTNVRPDDAVGTLSGADVLIVRTPGTGAVLLGVRSGSADPLRLQVQVSGGVPPVSADLLTAASVEVPLPPGDDPVLLGLGAHGRTADGLLPIEMTGIYRGR
jgi:hypothetical protein